MTYEAAVESAKKYSNSLGASAAVVYQEPEFGAEGFHYQAGGSIQEILERMANKTLWENASHDALVVAHFENGQQVQAAPEQAKLYEITLENGNVIHHGGKRGRAQIAAYKALKANNLQMQTVVVNAAGYESKVFTRREMSNLANAQAELDAKNSDPVYLEQQRRMQDPHSNDYNA